MVSIGNTIITIFPFPLVDTYVIEVSKMSSQIYFSDYSSAKFIFVFHWISFYGTYLTPLYQLGIVPGDSALSSAGFSLRMLAKRTSEP